MTTASLEGSALSALKFCAFVFWFGKFGLLLSLVLDFEGGADDCGSVGLRRDSSGACGRSDTVQEFGSGGLGSQLNYFLKSEANFNPN